MVRVKWEDFSINITEMFNSYTALNSKILK